MADNSSIATGAGGLPGDVHADADTDSPVLVARRLLAECFGTFLLVTVDWGGAVIGSRRGRGAITRCRGLANRRHLAWRRARDH